MTDNAHDPGSDRSSARVKDLPQDVAAEPIHLGAGAADTGVVRIGTASWTDPTMTAAGVFYPDGADSAEERLAYYASRFPLVEVDSTYYALPVATDRRAVGRAHAARLHLRHQGARADDRPADRDQAAAEGPAGGAARGHRRQAAHLRQGPARRAARRRVGLVRRRARAAQGGRPARLDPAPVPALVLHLIGEPRRRSRRRSGGSARPG